MIISKRHLPRRTVLRGLGASIALPLLDGMVPAFAATPAPARRFCAFYLPMGMSMGYWIPKSEGPLEVPQILDPMAAFKDRMLVVSGCDNKESDSVSDGGPHPRAQTAWLTGVAARRTEGSDIRAGKSLDQYIADEFGKETQLPSLELSLEDVSIPRPMMSYAGVYSSTIAWRTPTTPLPMEHNPRVVFERLFGTAESTDRDGRLKNVRRTRSLLDGVLPKIDRLRSRLGAPDQARLDEHLEAVRDVERRVQKAEAQVDVELPAVERPRGVPPAFGDHAALMFDLLLLAYKTDITRVVTHMYGIESSNRSFPEVGVPDSWHPLSHHVNDPVKLKQQAKLNSYHVKLLHSFVEKLAATPDGDGSLLDGTVILYGSGMSDSNQHTHLNLPTLLVTGRKIDVKAGRHLAMPKGTSHSNLLLSVLDKLNVRSVEHVGNSTGKFDGMLSL